MENKEIKKITLELTEPELFRLDQLLKLGLDAIGNIELNKQGIEKSADAINENIIFVAKVMAQLNPEGINQQIHYETLKAAFDVKLADMIKKGGV